MEIEKYVSEKNVEKVIQECLNSRQIFSGLFLGKIMKKDSLKCDQFLSQIEKKIENKNRIIRVKLFCFWCNSEQLANLWNKMSKGSMRWNNIQIVFEEPVDYYVIINSAPQNAVFDKKKTIIFQMEPHMNLKNWGIWGDPDNKEYFKVCKHREKEYNNNEWWLSKSYSQLCREQINKKSEYNSILSTVLSSKYFDPGHIKRIDFVKFLEQKGMEVHVYGDNKWDYKGYKKPLPDHCKDEAIFPYKYIFNAENHSIPYYYTEKLIDGILGECLTFYWGCPNIRELLDPRAYVYLELSNFEIDYAIIQKAINEDWHSKRLPFIRQEKKRILNELQFFPRLERILGQVKNNFIVCHCGNVETNHNFKHTYEGIANVTRITELGDELYILNAENYSVKKGVKCSKENCTAEEKLHGTKIVEHDYSPVEYNYREIRFVLPENSICNNCGEILEKHRDNMTHRFSTKVKIENKGEKDIIFILDSEDEDRKIDY